MWCVPRKPTLSCKDKDAPIYQNSTMSYVKYLDCKIFVLRENSNGSATVIVSDQLGSCRLP